MIIANLNYLEDVVESTTIKGGADYNDSSILTWADSLLADLDKNGKTKKTLTKKGKPASKLKKVENKVGKKETGSYAVAYSSATYSVS